MTFGQAIAICSRKYADFTGRAGRPEFWWFILFGFLVSAGLSIIDSAFAIPQLALPHAGEYLIGTPAQLDVADSPRGGILEDLWALAILLPTLAAAVRRLRDSGREWGNIFWILLPFAGAIVLIVQLVQPTTAEAPTTEATPTS